MDTLRVALIQLDPGDDKAANLDRAFRFVDEAAAGGAELIALPESFHVRGDNALRFATAEPVPGPLSERLADAAKRHGAFLLAGSYNVRVPGQERLSNTSLLFAPDGEQIGRYSKIHLFDAVIDGELVARESSRNRPGERPLLVDTPFGKLGMTVCYDVRFPELYRLYALAGATLVTVPSNFALQTGKDHWEVLLRARAIENALFVIAPATIGGRGFVAYGRSMVVDPWGTVIACAPDVEGVTFADLDLSAVARVRERLPSLRNRRPQSYRLADHSVN